MDKPASNQSEFQQLWDSWTAWYSDNGPPPVESARVLVDEGEQRYGAAEEGVNFYTRFIKPHALAILMKRTRAPDGGHTHHDEHLFVMVHQMFELVFAQIVWELRSIVVLFEGSLAEPLKNSGSAQLISERFLRCEKLMRLASPFFEVLETMHPQTFLEFRPFLEDGSGFQSMQVREIECLLGLERLESDLAWQMKQYGAKQADIRKQWEDAQKLRSIKLLLHKWLAAIDTPPGFKEAWYKAKKSELVRESVQRKELQLDSQKKVEEGMEDARKFLSGGEDHLLSKARWSALYLSTERAAHPILSSVLDAILAFEESLLIWRSIHPRMVDRMIGARTGTGGSAGTAYLDRMRNARVFDDLWALRTFAVRSSVCKLSSIQEDSC